MNKILLVGGLGFILSVQGQQIAGDTAITSKTTAAAPESETTSASQLNDEQLLVQIRQMARRSKKVEFHVRNGVVTMDGSVRTEMEKNSLEGALSQLDGVNDINNNLKVNAPVASESVGSAPAFVSGRQQSDEPLLKQVRDSVGQSKSVEVFVQSGAVTLDGTIESEVERRKLEARIGQLPGVMDINNNLKVVAR